MPRTIIAESGSNYAKPKGKSGKTDSSLNVGIAFPGNPINFFLFLWLTTATGGSIYLPCSKAAIIGCQLNINRS
ncbi:hypothetical protein MMC2321_01553 [Chitinophaga sp. MM2321]